MSIINNNNNNLRDLILEQPAHFYSLTRSIILNDQYETKFNLGAAGAFLFTC